MLTEEVLGFEQVKHGLRIHHVQVKNNHFRGDLSRANKIFSKHFTDANFIKIINELIFAVINFHNFRDFSIFRDERFLDRKSRKVRHFEFYRSVTNFRY